MPRATHIDPRIDSLYIRRRGAADEANESGFRGIDGWRHLELIEDELRACDPDGDWRHEGRRDHFGPWEVNRP